MTSGRSADIEDEAFWRIVDADLAFMDAWSTIRETMPAQYIRMFLLVLRHEGLPVLDYAKMINRPDTTASRHISDIGDFDRNHEPGFGLLTYKLDARDSRKKLVVLTPKGRALAHRFVRAQKAILR